jgi:hypothetical protein
MTDPTPIKQSPLNGLRNGPELFLALPPPGSSGKPTPFRELTDEALVELLKNLEAQHKQTVQQALSALDQSAQLGQSVAVVKFEMERRSKTLTIAQSIPH